MREIPVADTTFATIGAVLWSVQVIPQIIKSHRTKNTTGLSPILMFIWAVAAFVQGSYLIAQHSSIPLQIQPQLFGAFGAMSWAQCLHYGVGFSKIKALACLAAFYIIAAGFEFGSVHALWAGERNGTEAPLQVYGWVASALLAGGLIPEFYEIYKHGEVIGISLIFMAVDMLGGVFSFLSLLFRSSFDYTAFVQYALVVVLDGVVVVLYFVLNPRAKRRRAREAALTDAESAAGVSAETESKPQGERDPQAEQVSQSNPMSLALDLGGGEDGRTLTECSEAPTVNAETEPQVKDKE